MVTLLFHDDNRVWSMELAFVFVFICVHDGIVQAEFVFCFILVSHDVEAAGLSGRDLSQHAHPSLGLACSSLSLMGSGNWLHSSTSVSWASAFLATVWKACSTLMASLADVSKYGMSPLLWHQPWDLLADTWGHRKHVDYKYFNIFLYVLSYRGDSKSRTVITIFKN